MHYLDFDLEVGPGREEEYWVAVTRSPAGEGQGPFKLPFAENELQNALAVMEREDTDASFLTEFGTRLFMALFSGDIRARYAESIGLIGHNAGLRIRLRLDTSELQRLPWELMLDPEKREFLVLTKRSLVTRYLHVPRATPPLEASSPLRVLVLVAAPHDLPPVEADDEVARIRQALQPLLDKDMMSVLVELRGTKRALRQRLLDYAPHVLHYIGHGGLERDRGMLLLEDEDGDTDPLDGPTLGTLLKGSTVRLAVLNACQSAREIVSDDYGLPSLRSAFMGVGPALVHAGLGAVVAMQFSIADTSARVFAEDFYGVLARFKPVDECVSRAREALLLEVGLDQLDWAAPVLFMRAPDGVLFNFQGREVGATGPETVERKMTDKAEGVSFRASAEVSNVDAVEQVNLRELRQILTKYFDIEELRDLCFDLDVDYDSLRGESKAGKARELISYLKRHGRIADLLETATQLRPDIPWK